MHHPTDRITHTTAFVTPVVEHWLEREIAQSSIRNEPTTCMVTFYFHPFHYSNCDLIANVYNIYFYITRV